MNSTLVIGLGNVGEKYTNTRHNVGFLVVEEIAKRAQSSWKEKRKLKAEISEISGESKLVLVKPNTFMNLSGEAVAATKDFYKPDSIVVVYDDADLKLGDIRIKEGGGTAGHNGVKSLVKHLGETGYVRVRCGIGRPTNENIPLDDFVLGKWQDNERAGLEKMIQQAADEIQKM